MKVTELENQIEIVDRMVAQNVDRTQYMMGIVAQGLWQVALQLARLTRRNEPEAPDFIKANVLWGAGPRASQYLVLGAKAHAVLMGRMFVTHEDIQAIAPPVLRHRIKTNFNADAEGITADDLIRKLIESVPVIPGEADGGKPQLFRSADAG